MTMFPELPDVLVTEILLRLPVRSILRFRCVCKNWLTIIQSPDFTKRQCQLANSSHSGKLLCFRKDPYTKSNVVSIVDYRTIGKVEDLEWPPFFEEEVVSREQFLRGINVLGPVNGIYCIFRRLVDRWVGTLTLWNPASREYKHIHPAVSFPFPPDLLSGLWNRSFDYEQKDPIGLHIGFGFDDTTHDYKVVVICHWGRCHGGDDDRWHVRVYSHASNSWRTIYFLGFNDVIPPFQGLHPPFPEIDSHPEISHCFLHGAFHWSCAAFMRRHSEGRYKSDLGYYVLVFNMSTETFQLMKAPPVRVYYATFRGVCAFKETIAMAAFGIIPSYDLQVWVMTDYGVDESWAMLYCFGEVIDRTLLGFAANGERLYFDKGQLISCGFNDYDQIEEHGVYGMKEQATYAFGVVFDTLGILNYVETLETLKIIDQQEV